VPPADDGRGPFPGPARLKILLVDDFSDSSKARKKQNFLDDLSNSGPAVRLYREGRATGPPEDRYRRMEKSDAVDDALAWGRKAAVACRVPVEVRPFASVAEGTQS